MRRWKPADLWRGCANLHAPLESACREFLSIPRGYRRNLIFYLGCWDNMVYALDATTGEPRWKCKLGRDFFTTLRQSHPCSCRWPRLYICSNDNTLHALDASNGNEVWTISAPKGGDPLGYSGHQ